MGEGCLAGDDERDKVGYAFLKGSHGAHYLTLAFLHMQPSNVPPSHSSSVPVPLVQHRTSHSNWQLMLQLCLDFGLRLHRAAANSHACGTLLLF